MAQFSSNSVCFSPSAHMQTCTYMKEDASRLYLHMCTYRHMDIYELICRYTWKSTHSWTYTEIHTHTFNDTSTYVHIWKHIARATYLISQIDICTYINHRKPYDDIWIQMTSLSQFSSNFVLFYPSAHWTYMKTCS